MPYGPEIDDNERRTNKTIHQRGLHLCSYQSSIERGFRHIQIGTKGISCLNLFLVAHTHIFSLVQHAAVSTGQACRTGF